MAKKVERYALIDVVEWLQQEGHASCRLWCPTARSVKFYLAAAEIERLRRALHSISFGAQNSQTTKEDLGVQACKALEGRVE